MAQQDSTVEWRVSLRDLEQRLAGLPAPANGAGESWRVDAETLRSSLAAFAASHPGMQVQVPEPLREDSSRDSLARQLDALKTVVDQVIKQTPNSPFNLGVINVTVLAQSPEPALATDSIDKAEIDAHDFTNIAKALDYLPGVSIQHIASNRNEAGIMVRGFVTRGQVPFYLDGIPISVPYDGFVDFNRFLTSDLAEVQVARGYSSPLLGPNALGGSINLVTREPVKKLESDALVGAGSGDSFLSSLRLGSRWRRFFVQGSGDWLQSHFVPLPGGFHVNQYPSLPDVVMSDRLNHSNARDDKYIARLGWTPRGEDEYVFTNINQKGNKGVPLYQGPDTAAPFRNFWAWPYWNMYSYYFHSHTAIGETSAINFRGYYNQFRNAIDMFSNDTYAVMNTANAERSIYDEHTDGGTAEFTTRILPRNVLSGSLVFRDDTHKERAVFPARSPFPLLAPDLLDRDQQTSIGVQDAITVSSRFRITAGFSADHFDGLQGQSYNSTNTGLVPFVCLASPANTAFSGCTAHVWNYNPQVSASYSLGDGGSFFVTFADRGRFPMLKDIYSASLGAGLPNPDIKPEHSRNWNIGYSHLLGRKTLVQAELFRSDLRDAIESVFVTDPGGTTGPARLCPNGKIVGFCSQMVNIGNEVHEGVELKVRTTPVPRLTLDASYSYLNRTIAYDFASFSTVSQPNTAIIILPTAPRNKVVGTAVVRGPHQILGMITGRFEGGLTLQDTTYATTSSSFLPFAESLSTADLGTIVPIRSGVSLEAGVKNLFDRLYYYTAGYPEAGRNWYANLRYRF